MLKTLKNYFVNISIVCVIAVLFRLLEIILVLINFDHEIAIIPIEILGLFYDLIFLPLILLIIFPLYHLICKLSIKISNILFYTFFILLCVVHLIAVGYFVFMKTPLDTVVFQHSFAEILTTIQGSGIPLRTYYLVIAALIVTVVAVILMMRTIFGKKPLTEAKIKKCCIIILAFSIPILILFNVFRIAERVIPASNISFFTNKSLFFYDNCFFAICEKISGKTSKFTTEDSKIYQALYPERDFINEEYPFLHKFNNQDSLNYYFDTIINPNFVFIIIESWSGDVLNNYHGVNMMPFLDSLKRKSLYWKNCLSVGERSFAAVPSSFGGLPYGETCFSEMKNNILHHSLVSVLGVNDYFTSFFCGDQAWFHSRDQFFNRNNIDLIVDCDKFDKKFPKIMVGDYFWGYDDADLFSQAMLVIDTLPKTKRMDAYFTASMHPPYAIKNEKKYEEKYNELLKTVPANEKQYLEKRKKHILSHLFMDDEIKKIMNYYANTENYENTIFVFVGDHAMNELTIENSIKRFHVPLLIYSPKIKTPKTYTHIVSHLDIYETFLGFLKNIDATIPPYSSSLGTDLFANNKNKIIPFMDDNRNIIDYYKNGYYISGNDFFKVNEDLSLEAHNDSDLKAQLTDELNVFKRINRYVCNNNKLLSTETFAENMFEIIPMEVKKEIASSKDEWLNLMPEKIVVENRDLILDVFFDYEQVGKDVFFVYELKDSLGNSVFWNSHGMQKGKNYFAQHLRIPKQNTASSKLILNYFIWNNDQTKKSVRVKNINAILY